MGCCGGGDGGAGAAREEEIKRQANIRAAMSNIDSQFTGFDDKFYDKRAQAYQNFALPQLGQQVQDTSRNLAYKLAGQRLLDSSASQFLHNSLGREVTRQQQGISDNARGQANQLRQNVEGERAQLYNQAQLSADPGLATRQAISSASTLQLPSSYAPINNLLQGWATNYLADQVAQTYNNNPYHGSSTSFAQTPVTTSYGR